MLVVVPTPESAAAFARLVATRARLTEITKLLNEAHAGLQSDGEAGRKTHFQLQAEWEAAFIEFETATEEFAATVHRIPRPAQS